MRLRRLDLTRYGKFTDTMLDFGEHTPGRPDFHLVYGPNEAGKSTAFDAYLSLLFGIETRTSYAFLHDYKAMLVGGALESQAYPPGDQAYSSGHQGRTLELRRTKGNINDLRTATGEILSTGALGQTLGGLTRETYRAMFSLDDRSLEEGGKAILESKGELGQMLFAASSGLSEITQQLGAIRDDADALFKPRARSTRMRELLDRLDELRHQQAATDIAAGQYEELRRETERTREAYRRVEGQHTARDQALRQLRRLVAALPLAEKRARLAAELLPLADLPEPPAGWSDEADQLASEDAGLSSRREANALLLGRLGRELDGAVPDQNLLGVADEIATLEELRSRYISAEPDLPKRIAALAEERVHLAILLAELGCPPGTEAETLLLDIRTTTRLTELANSHAALEAAVLAAGHEAASAREALRVAETEAPAGDVTRAPIDALEDLLARIARDNHGAALAQLREAQAAAQDQLDALERKLAPFSGGIDVLAKLDAPSIPSIERLVREHMAATEDARLAAAGWAEKAERAATLGARAAAMTARAEITDDAALAKLGERRDAAWHAHLDTLKPGSEDGAADLAASSATRQATAEHYARAARDERDALLANQNQAEALGAWRAASLALSEAEAALAAGTVRKGEASTRLAALRHETDAALARCRLPAGMHPEELVAWLAHRDTALALAAGIEKQRRHAEALAQALGEDVTELAQRLATLGDLDARKGFSGPKDFSESAAKPVVEASLSTLIPQAQRALTRAAAAAEKHASAQRALGKARQDLAERQARHAGARQALEAWQTDWTAALAGTWLAARPTSTGAGGPSIGEVRAVLGVLTRLHQTLETIGKLTHQIESMRADQAAFVTALQSLCERAGHPFDPGNPRAIATALDAALAREREKLALRRDKEREQAAASQDRLALEDALRAFAARRDRMLAHFAVTDIAGLRQALRQASHAVMLRAEIQSLETQITASLHAPDLVTALECLAAVDIDRAGAEIERLEREQQASLAELQALYHEQRVAETSLAAVSSDDKVARLREQQRTIGLEIEEAGLRYLRLRIGAHAVDTALRAYRDQHRSSMLRDAAARFRRITDGSFTDLQTLVTDKGESLVGVQATGRSLLAEAMSKGTRDQLFLALRMAGYLEFVKTREALPFVADDIMETFDDARAAATLAMFQEVALHGQVIYLTHHEHLCAIARAVCGDAVRITQL